MPGHYKLRRENALRSFWRARYNGQGNLSRWNGLQNPRIAPLSCPITRIHSQTGSPETDSPFRESPEQRSTTRSSTTKARVQSVQRKVEGYDLQHGNIRRDLRDHSKHTMLQLYDILAESIVYCTFGTCLRPFGNSTLTATMFCQFPVMSFKRDHPVGDATGIRQDRESTIMPKTCSQKSEEEEKLDTG